MSLKVLRLQSYQTTVEDAIIGDLKCREPESFKKPEMRNTEMGREQKNQIQDDSGNHLTSFEWTVFLVGILGIDLIRHSAKR